MKYKFLCGLIPLIALTGCISVDYGIDYSEYYADFLQYSIGGNVQETGREKNDTETGYTYFQADYTSANGEERSLALVSGGMESFEWPRFDTKKNFADWNFFLQISAAMTDIATMEFAEKIVSKYFGELEYTADKSEYVCDDYTVYIKVYDTFARESAEHSWLGNDYYRAHCNACISPDTGYKLSNADLRSFAARPEVLTVLNIGITADDADIDGYKENFRAAVDEFKAYVGDAQSYYFYLKDECRNVPLVREYVYCGFEVAENSIVTDPYNFEGDLIQKAKAITGYVLEQEKRKGG